jgi:5-methylcytosine-specific restriction endonuclease McrA
MYKNHEDTLAAARKLWRKQSRTPQGRYRALKKAAKFRNISLTLSFDEYVAITHNKVCFYCGNALPIVGYGLDRRDRSEGYHKTNVVPCCTECNRLKGFLEGKNVSPTALAKIAETLRGTA